MQLVYRSVLNLLCIDFKIIVDNKDQLKINRLSQLLLQLKGAKSEVQFAKELDTTPYSLNRWINRVHFPNTESLLKIANYMDITIDALYEHLEDQKRLKNNTAIALMPYIEQLPQSERMKLIKLIAEKYIK